MAGPRRLLSLGVVAATSFVGRGDFMGAGDHCGAGEGAWEQLLASMLPSRDKELGWPMRQVGVLAVAGCFLGVLAAEGCASTGTSRESVVRGADGELVLEVRDATFDGSHLKARVGLSSRSRGFTFNPNMAYCQGLFRIVEARRCGGEIVGPVIQDCAGGGVPKVSATAFPAELWLGMDGEWVVAEEFESCVEVVLQAFPNGSEGDTPRLRLRALANGSVTVVSSSGTDAGIGRGQE